MSKHTSLIYMLWQEDTDLWTVHAVDLPRSCTFTGPRAEERATEWAEAANARRVPDIYEIRRRWLEEHKISDGAGWLQRLRHRVYVWLNLPSNETGPP